MIALTTFAGTTVAMMGLGKSGLATAKALLDSGALVWVWDDAALKREAAMAAGMTVVDLAACNWSQVAALVWSPGIAHIHPKPHPVAITARAHGIEPVCDVDLLARTQHEATYVGITGTNGKSTTTALIAHILAVAGRSIAVGGNLGPPVLEFPALGTGGTYVIEMSSYQLELSPTLRPDVAVLLNITPDHLGRHGGLEGYIAAKRRLFALQNPGTTAIVGIDDDICRSICLDLTSKGDRTVIAISAIGAVPGGIGIMDGHLIDDRDGTAQTVMDLARAPALPGRHNWQNAAAAYAATRALGVSVDVIVTALETFPGLAHRQEMIAMIDGVRYVNDSKATNADAAEKAMLCYDAIYWILGGQAKEGGIEPLASLFPRVRHAFLIGEAAEVFASTLRSKVAFTHCGHLDRAIAEASAMASREQVAGAVVLLSPACASWDQFANFEARGDAFRQAVGTLPGHREAPRP